MDEFEQNNNVEPYENTKEIVIPLVLPLLPVRDVVIFTNMMLPLFLGREKSIIAAEEAIQNSERFIFITTQKDSTQVDPTADSMYSVGTIAKILRMLNLPDGRIKILIQGIIKAKIVRYTKQSPIYYVKVDLLQDKIVTEISLEDEAMMRSVREHSSKILSLKGELTNDIHMILDNIDDPGKLADLVASNLQLKSDEAQHIMELTDPIERLKQVNDYLAREVDVNSIKAKIQNNVQDEISKTQRDYYLREHLRAIHKELGEIDEYDSEIASYQQKIKKCKMSKDAETESLKQLHRFELMQSDSAEATIIRAYLDYLLELPWEKTTQDCFDMTYCEKILNDAHYGLEKIKDRILEHLSVRKLNPNMKGPILCFVGPPGVGKTSLGQATAKAIKRKFVRMSLGGIRDEAEIRGHRRTYIGALPGRIIQGLIQCQSCNPVFMLDEIDKLVSDFRGDPSAALLEVLDPEQNSTFCDHYLNIPFDLSKVMFIMTANYVDTLPSALLDRMEVINIPGYTEDEKLEIAEKHLIPKQIKENGLSRRKVVLSKEVIYQTIVDYTYESGVRNLERELASILRKIARKIANKERGPFNITPDNLHILLGPPKYLQEMELDKHEVGIATGLAWTQSGGEPLFVEATIMRGKGELILTGQLGDIMQESARAALTYARSYLNDKRSIRKDFFDRHDIHVHVPSGAIPKDGPSAGIAIAISLISTLTQRPVNRYVAMTGEITLRGRILPIGGLKEKSIGAIKAGIKTMIIPQKNQKDLMDVPDSVTKQLNYVMAKHMDDILEMTLEESLEPKKKKQKKKQKTNNSNKQNSKKI